MPSSQKLDSAVASGAHASLSSELHRTEGWEKNVLTYVWFVSRQNGEVSFIAMAADNFVTRALPKSFYDSEAVSYWTTCLPEDLVPFLTADYEVWIDDLSMLSDEPGSGAEIDPKDEISWEMEPVQLWVKGEPISRDFVAKNSELIGFGDEFTFQDVASEFPSKREVMKARLEKLSRSTTDIACPWCGVTAVRRYNFTRPFFDEESEMPSNMDNPVLWTDGAWSETGVDPDCKNFIENQFGDSVVICPACNALFLASAVELPGSDEYQIQRAVSEFVLPGQVAKGLFEKTLSEEWILSAQLDQTMDYLEQNLEASGLITWSQWTAAQQVVNWVSYIIRTGDAISTEQDSRARSLIAEICSRFSQIKEGTLGFDYAFNDVSSDMDDENFFVHTYVLEEALPKANMRRIAGDWHEIEYTLGRNLFEIGSLEDLEEQGLHEFDEYIIRRRLVLRDLIENKDTRWAVHSGELQDLGPSMSNRGAKGETGTVDDLEPGTRDLESEFVSDDQGELDYDSVLALPPEMIQVEMRRFLDVLHPRESAVLRSRFGLGDGLPKSYKEIAESFAVEPQRIRQIEVETLERLRGLDLSLELLEFLS